MKARKKTKTKPKKMTREHRARVDRVLAARKRRKDLENFKSRQSVKRMEKCFREIWAYLADPDNRISNHDAANILVSVKKGLGEAAYVQ